MYTKNLFINQTRAKQILTSLKASCFLVLFICLGILAVFNINGNSLGHFILPLFLLSELPLLANFYLIFLVRLGFSPPQITRIFSRYYMSGLIFHSLSFTLTLGVVFIHMISLLAKATYCIILMAILIFLWFIEYNFWKKRWPLHPTNFQSSIAYWFHWTTIFGLIIGLPFHAGTWSLFTVAIFAPVTFGSLFLIIIQDFSNLKSKSQEFGSSIENIS